MRIAACDTDVTFIIMRASIPVLGLRIQDAIFMNYFRQISTETIHCNLKCRMWDYDPGFFRGPGRGSGWGIALLSDYFAQRRGGAEERGLVVVSGYHRYNSL